VILLERKRIPPINLNLVKTQTIMKKLLPLFLFLIPALLPAQSTGFMSPTATPAPNGGWTNPANAFTSDDVYTTVPHQSGCRCPFLYLSWDNGVSYTSSDIVGPYGTTDNSMIAGSSSDLWGHAWSETEFTNGTFRLKIANPSTLIEQGYGDFNFVIPPGSAITGIEVRVEEHGDSAYSMEFIDAIRVNVHYTTTTSISVVSLASELSVYPNPASTQFTVDHLLPSTQRISLLDMSGRIVMEAMDFSSGQCTFNVADLPRGMYILQIANPEAGILTRKVVVQ
jgi:hypothetical protein